MTETSTPERNWAGNYTYRAEKLHRPRSLEELQEIVTKAPRVRALGSRHSFNDIADSSELISLETLTDVESLPEAITVDRQANTVSFGGGVKYGELVETLNDEGLALHNMASLPALLELTAIQQHAAPCLPKRRPSVWDQAFDAIA